MSKGIIFLFLLAGLMSFCSAIVCTPNFCKMFKCEEVTEETCRSQKAVLVPHGSFCGCCPSCISLSAIPDAPVKLCPLRFIGSSERAFYPC